MFVVQQPLNYRGNTVPTDKTIKIPGRHMGESPYVRPVHAIGGCCSDLPLLFNP